MEVTVAGVTGAGNIVMSRNVIVGAEKSLKDALASAPFDAVILPGGLKGAEAFAEVLLALLPASYRISISIVLYQC